jgi:SAM-dependent methyltransferase
VTLSDSWNRGDPYEQYIGRWSRQVAPRFLSWLDVPAGQRWLDVGCGTGALSASIVDERSPAVGVGLDPSPGFLREARARLGDRVALIRGTAGSIPLAGSSVDVIGSGLTLNFVPDGRAALAEWSRVTRRGGTLAAYVWDYAGRMELIRHFWDGAVGLDPAAAPLDEGTRFPVCRPEALRALFQSAGLEAVEVMAIDVPTVFVSFDGYWQPFLGGQGPAPAYAMSLDEPARDSLREALRQRLPTREDGSISLIARAWAVRGINAA